LRDRQAQGIWKQLHVPLLTPLHQAVSHQLEVLLFSQAVPIVTMSQSRIFNEIMRTLFWGVGKHKPPKFPSLQNQSIEQRIQINPCWISGAV
jgi:hypothetical protein